MRSHKKVIITGASGFLGSHLVERIKSDKRYEVYALSSRSDELKEKIGGKNVEYLHKDIIVSSFAQEILKDAVIINCAYPRNSTGTAIADGLKYIQRVFECAVEAGAAAIINISTQSVYSQQRTEAATEVTPMCLESPYAVGKYAVELMLESICKRSKTVCTNIRLASLIGPEFDQRVVNRLAKQALETGKLIVKKNRQKFGFFDVEDAVSGIVAMLDSNMQEWKPVYNLGREGTYTLVEIAEAIKKVLKTSFGRECIVEVNESHESLNTEIDSSNFWNTFRLRPTKNIYNTIEEIIKKKIE